MSKLKLNWFQRLLKALGLLVVKTERVEKEVIIEKAIPFNFNIQRGKDTLKTIFEVTGICDEKSFRANVYGIDKKGNKEYLEVTTNSFDIEIGEDFNYKFTFKD